MAKSYTDLRIARTKEAIRDTRIKLIHHCIRLRILQLKPILIEGHLLGSQNILRIKMWMRW
ncbi:hypothetical protein [Bacillus cereus]|uniref:hypothetical protein n=1 Tax=Bacillus cereus TaxID=1396 RepID=UPI000BFB8152|nr:hypothetical protein [Bacillus cereus]PGY19516.1 hypothetical protein COE23_01115 [Bacillus cereus]